LKKIIYITQRKTNILSDFANSSQVVNTSKELAKLNSNFELFILNHKNYSKDFLLDQIKNKYENINFKVKSIHNSILFKKDILYGLFLSIKFFFNKSIFYTRNDWVAFFFTLMNKPVFFEAHDYNEKRICLILMKKLVNNKENLKIITISNALKNKFKEEEFNNSIYVVHDGVDNNFYYPINKYETRKEIGLDLNSKIVLYSGALREGRGLSRLIEIARLKKNTQFLVFGGRDKKRLKFLKQQSKDLSNIYFYGFVKKDLLKKYMDAADIFLMPHQKNCDIIKFTSPLKMFEYLAMGKPIIASEFPVFKEVLRNDFNALLVNAESENDFAKKIDILFNDKNKYNSLSKNALISSKKYSWKNRAADILSVLKC